jgi:hypothetical protein
VIDNRQGREVRGMSEGTLKTLDKMTKPKLIELAHETHGVEGAHGMSKEQLVEAVAAAMKEAGTFVEEGEHKLAAKKAKKIKVDKLTLKKQVKESKQKRDEAQKAGDAKAMLKARKRIHQAKGLLRRYRKIEA